MIRMIHISNTDEIMLSLIKQDVPPLCSKNLWSIRINHSSNLSCKDILRRLWKLSQSWDNPLSSDLILEWKKVAQVLVQTLCLKLPHFVT